MRHRLTYANVVSTLALFLALSGGVVIAAQKIGSKDIKAGAVRSKQIANDSVKGVDVAESSLGQVPSAVRAQAADRADSAASAVNADRVDGFEGADLKLACPAGTAAFAGVCIETAARGSALYDTAASTCASVGRRLPGYAELDGYRRQAGVTISTNEFTSERDSGPGYGTIVLVLSDTGAPLAVDTGSVSEPYRCVGGPSTG